MAEPLDMTYVALRPLRVGGATRQKGELVPEATTWHNLDAYIRGGRIAPVPRTAVNQQDLEEAERAFEQRNEQARKAAESEEAPRTSEEASDEEVEELEEEHTKEELYDEAQELDVEGRSSMDKDELAEAIIEEREEQEQLDEEVEQYAVGNGWYEVPGVDKKLRRDDAIEALTSEDKDEE